MFRDGDGEFLVFEMYRIYMYERFEVDIYMEIVLGIGKDFGFCVLKYFFKYFSV